MPPAMKFYRDPFFILLLVFGFISITSVTIILSLNKKKSTYIDTGNIKNPGVFVIESPNEVSVSSTYQAEFVADTKGQAVNAVNLLVNFDPEKFNVLSVDTSKSFCQFYPENKFNNNKGTISISCGSPNPGFTGKSVIAKVSFFTKTTGQTNITISPKSQILLNNGKGTNIFFEPVSHQVSILNGI